MDAPTTSLKRHERGIHALWSGAGGAGVTEAVYRSAAATAGILQRVQAAAEPEVGPPAGLGLALAPGAGIPLGAGVAVGLAVPVGAAVPVGPVGPVGAAVPVGAGVRLGPGSWLGAEMAPGLDGLRPALDRWPRPGT